MDFTECTKLLLTRIEKFEPEIATKIMGYLFLNRKYEEILEYALGSDTKLISLILEAKSFLISAQFAPQFIVPFPFELPPFYCSIPPNTMPSPPNSPQFEPNLCNNSSQLCHYYTTKGICKNGERCRFVHGSNFNDWGELEMEIREILLSRGRIPLSIVSLPMVYLERYGKVLQAEGYLTESQRNIKPGYSLTRLLAQLRTIVLIERPHGQHSLVLAEDAHKYIDYTIFGRHEISSSCHQIYLTFPADSKFSEKEVEIYFSKYGPVREVRIPRQSQRMFGFVSFVFPETVQLILSSSHPHYIGSSRILVKPYKEKSALNERRVSEVDPCNYNARKSIDLGLKLDTLEGYNSCNGRCFRNKVMSEMEIDMALERRERRLIECQQMCKKLTGGPMHDLNSLNSDSLHFAHDQFRKLKIDVGQEMEKSVATSNISSNLDSGEIDLPDSPFA